MTCSRMLRSGLVCVAVAGAVAASVPAMAGARETAHGPNCHSQFNPYRYTPKQLHACGLTTIPETSRTRLPGGGVSHNYGHGSTETDIATPSRRWNPLTASASELAAYDLPARPAPPRPLGDWSSRYAHAHFAAAPRFLVERRRMYMVGAGVFGNPGVDSIDGQAGYQVIQPAGTFTSVKAVFVEPRFRKSACSNGGEGTWAGLGGGPSLAQDGTAHGIDGWGNGQAWYEIYPQEGAIALDYIAPPRQHVEALVRYNRATQMYNGLVGNARTHQFVSWSSSGAGIYNGSVAQVIVEVQNGALPNFAPIAFSTTRINGVPLNQWSNLVGANMVDKSGLLMARVSPMYAGGFFIVSHRRCDQNL